MSYGMDAFFGLTKQTTFGGSATVATFTPFLSESIKANIDQLKSMGLRQRYDEGTTTTGIEKYEGDVNLEIHPLNIGHFLRAAMGQSSVSASGSAYLHQFTPATTDFSATCALPPYTVELYRGVGLSHRYYNAIFPALDLEFAQNALHKCKVTMRAVSEELAAKSTPTFITDNIWGIHVNSVSLNAVGITDIENLKISFNENVEGVPTLTVNSGKISQFRRNGFRTLKVTGSFIYNVQSQYIDFDNQTEQRLLMNIGPSITSYNLMTIDIPNLRFTDFNPQVAGPGLNRVSFSADGNFNTTSNYSWRVTLVNTVASY